MQKVRVTVQQGAISKYIEKAVDPGDVNRVTWSTDIPYVTRIRETLINTMHNSATRHVYVHKSKHVHPPTRGMWTIRPLRLGTQFGSSRYVPNSLARGAWAIRPLCPPLKVFW